MAISSPGRTDLCRRDGVQKMDMRIKIAWVLNATTYIAAICMVAFKCWPLHRQWQINPDPGSRCMFVRVTLPSLTLLDNCYPGASKLQISFVMAINTITDMYLMAIPLPARLTHAIRIVG